MSDPRDARRAEIAQGLAADETTDAREFVRHLIPSWIEYEVPEDPASLIECEGCQ